MVSLNKALMSGGTLEGGNRVGWLAMIFEKTYFRLSPRPNKEPNRLMDCVAHGMVPAVVDPSVWRKALGGLHDSENGINQLKPDLWANRLSLLALEVVPWPSCLYALLTHLYNQGIGGCLFAKAASFTNFSMLKVPLICRSMCLVMLPHTICL